MFYSLLLLIIFNVICTTYTKDYLGEEKALQEPPDGLKPGSPPLYLQLSPEILEQPAIQKLYTGQSHVDAVPFLDLEQYLNKRQAEKKQEASFSLRVNPVIPRNPLNVRNYSKECQERKQWCAELPTPTHRICPPIDTPTPVPGTCGPTKPTPTPNIYSYCRYDRTDIPRPRDPCDECPSTTCSSTTYVACISSPPPTAAQRLKYCHPTTLPCHKIPCTYKVLTMPTPQPPPSPPSCDVSFRELNGNSKYYIVVKRSPELWKRLKRSNPKRVYKIVRQPFGRMRKRRR